MFFYESCEIPRKIYFDEHLRTTAFNRNHCLNKTTYNFPCNYRLSEFFLGRDNALHFKYFWRICQEKVKMQRRGRVFFNGLQTDYVAVIENKMWLIRWNVFQYVEAVAQRCSVKKVFLEILQNSRENTCARVSCLIKLQASGLKACNFIKKETLAEVFVNFVKFLRAPFLTETSGGCFRIRYVIFVIN